VGGEVSVSEGADAVERQATATDETSAGEPEEVEE
jgi:hypothetical protein